MMSKPKSRCFRGGPVAKTLCLQCRGGILITGQGTRPCMLLLKDLTCCSEDQRSHMLQLRPTFGCSQTNIFSKKNPKENLSIGNGLSNIN